MTYQPQGRTEQASYDYTDDPAQLRHKFDRAILAESLRDAEEYGDKSVCLKFDFEEYVPIEAVREALR